MAHKITPIVHTDVFEKKQYYIKLENGEKEPHFINVGEKTYGKVKTLTYESTENPKQGKVENKGNSRG